MKRFAMPVLALFCACCAPSLAERCSERGEQILAEGRKSGDVNKASERLERLHGRCVAALSALAAVEAALEE